MRKTFKASVFSTVFSASLILTSSLIFSSTYSQQSSMTRAFVIRSVEMDKELRDLYEAKPESYEPRTEHFLSNGEPTYVNRLIKESSPYLLQHAHNPVDWRPWGNEALAEAAAADLPVFLSIGYSTCHWCHVMERESFENAEIASILNTSYLPIKVDREQRPDVDQIYMSAVQLSTGRGGWPMSAILLPDGKPFYTGTYFPPDSFKQLLLQGAKAWDDQRLEITIHANDLSRSVNDYLTSVEEAAELSDEALQASISLLLRSYDSLQGGFSQAPKFPQEPIQGLLMQIARDGGPLAKQALNAVEHTLDEIQRGGITDQIGGGFHRYSTDNAWLVPHFEKMLYNQAQLGKLFVEAYELTAREDFKRTAKRTFDYVLREMTSPLGTFYSATDADNMSEHGEMEEGDFFIWSPANLTAILSPDDAKRAIDLFGVTANGNFEGRTILTLPEGVSSDDLAFVDRISSTLTDERSKRNPPLRDDKVIVSWNGQLIEALATAGHVFDEPAYVEAAAKAAESIFSTNWNAKSGKLNRIQFNGEADKLDGQLDDYAALALASLKLYDITFENKWYARAGALISTMEREFQDEDASFYMTASLEGTNKKMDLITRPKDFYDGAQPSSNSLAFGALVEFYKRNGQPMLRRSALETWTRLSGNALNQTRAHPTSLLYGLKMNQDTASSLRFAGNGTVKLNVTRNRDQLTLEAIVKEGWHMNANKPLQADYIPTVFEGKDFGDIKYPSPKLYKPSFSDEKLSVYDGKTIFTTTLKQDEPSLASLQIQVCSDEICLPPETISLFVPAAGK